jgi:peroxiredoxin
MEMMSLSSYKGKKNVVLYFYPKDGTPACTIEAIGFSDREDEFSRIDTVSSASPATTCSRTPLPRRARAHRCSSSPTPSRK